MHLWGKMAQQQAAQRHTASAQSPSSPPSSSPSGLAGNLRPHYFAKSPTLTALLSGKSASSSSTPSSALASLSNLHHAYPTPPSSPPLAPKDAHTPTPTPQQAVLATMASQTLASKLGSAFWDAFARPAPGGAVGAAGASAKREWDADKVRRVMEGTAVVRVVDVEPTQQPARAALPASLLAKQEKQLQQEKCGGCAATAVADLLAESMATLNISRK